MNQSNLQAVDFFSVIVPTRNRPDKLATCLQSFTGLDYPQEAWELIVVNDGGDGSFSNVTSDLGQSLPLRLVEIKHAGPAAARNVGADLARGDYLAFTDDDCRVDAVWLRHFSAAFRDSGWDALGGQLLNASPDNVPARAAQHLLDFLLDYMHDEEGNALLLLSNNVAYKRSVFEALGGFDQTFPWAAAEDLELSHRLVAQGYRQCLCPEARVWHEHRLTWRAYVVQQFRYGRGGVFFQRARGRATVLRPVCPREPRSFYTELGQWLWQVRVPFAIWLLIILSQVAYWAGKLYQGLQPGPGEIERAASCRPSP